MCFAAHFSLCQTQGLLRVEHLGKRWGCALHSGDGFRVGRGLATGVLFWRGVAVGYLCATL